MMKTTNFHFEKLCGNNGIEYKYSGSVIVIAVTLFNRQKKRISECNNGNEDKLQICMWLVVLVLIVGSSSTTSHILVCNSILIAH